MNFIVTIIVEILSQEMDGNGSGFFRLKYKKPNFCIEGIGLKKADTNEYLTFLALQSTPESHLESQHTSSKRQGHKASIYVLTQVRQENGKISVLRTELSLKEWLAELERRREGYIFL